MSYISDLITTTVAPGLSRELQRHLTGAFGGVVRAYLPQVWWFSTESGHASLLVSVQGVVSVTDGQSGTPDAAIAWTDRAFSIALTTHDRSKLPAGTPEPKVTIHTPKGQAAYNQLRRKIGL